jgi:hypothetical protein
MHVDEDKLCVFKFVMKDASDVSPLFLFTGFRFPSQCAFHCLHNADWSVMLRPRRQKSAAARDLDSLGWVMHSQSLSRSKPCRGTYFSLALPNPHTKKNPPHLLQPWSSSKFRDNRRHLTTVHRKSIRSKNQRQLLTNITDG